MGIACRSPDPAIVTIGPAGNVRIEFPELDAVGYQYDPVRMR